MKESYIYCTRYQEWYNSLDKLAKEQKLECDRNCSKCEYHKIMWVEED